MPTSEHRSYKACFKFEMGCEALHDFGLYIPTSPFFVCMICVSLVINTARYYFKDRFLSSSAHAKQIAAIYLTI